MAIQSLSIVVPGNKCINNCKFCVSRTHEDIVYEDRLTDSGRYSKALRYARDLGCTTVMLTGEIEPQQNMDFLSKFFDSLMPKTLYNGMQAKPIFNNIEIQTTGRGLTEDQVKKLTRWGVNTFSLSLSSFNENVNSYIISDKAHSIIPVKDLCKWIKDAGCLLRLSLNLNSEFYEYSPEELFKFSKETYNADQVTLRKLYKSGKNCEQDKWITEHCDVYKDDDYFQYIKVNGIPLETLPYGLVKYSLHGVGTVADNDCMAKKNTDEIRYLILRPDCHLYTRWDDPASIIF